ncbi:ATPase, T2SS/T4P/T4SS family [Tersicoccus sp. MR15.9]|uniref:GspE/PulE family protein n=1 Tax=Tersicoccus mangrovi TaxID=3121635 RepID=UPI002FE69EF1
MAPATTITVQEARLRAHLKAQHGLTEVELDAAAADGPLLTSLVKAGRLTYVQANTAFAYTRGHVYRQLDSNLLVEDEVLELVDAALAREHLVLPLSLDGDTLTVAMAQPGDLNVLRILRGSGHGVSAVWSPKPELEKAVARFYSTSAEARKAGARAAKAYAGAAVVASDQGVDAGEIPATLNIIIEGALRAGASDIHLEPAEHYLSVRYSVDGRIVPEAHQSKVIGPRLIQLIKTRAKLDAAELRNQDGVLTHRFEGVNHEIRVAVLPAQWGESVTLRLGADQSRTLDGIGFAADTEARWRRALAQPNGIVLAVGPMGSGKTMLNYASLVEFIEQGRKIVTLEDPVERRFPEGVTQVSINPDQGLTWDAAMATTLRSAASVLFVGEINRESIAHTAISAALSGHTVLSTLHTNDAPTTVVRLREMGIRPSVLADSLRAVCAQRLPALLCPACKIPTTPTPDLVREFGLDEQDLAGVFFDARPGGCEACGGRGFAGRAPIHELMTFGREVRELITADAPMSAIAAAASAAGMRTLAEDGRRLAREGRTSLTELRRHILLD